MQNYREGSKVFQDWEIVRLIGEGASGKVFEIQKTNFGITTKSALKVISIPKSVSDVKAALSEGMDERSVTTYFQGFVQEIIKEIAIMAEVKSHNNIVSYEDHTVIAHAGTIGWDILIRMELLTPMTDYLMNHSLTEQDVIKIGKDLCRALVFCQKKGLIHRDIKPENIFVNEQGDFKLGDFGIARTVEKTTGGLSKKGTESYMAPEIYLGKPYGASVDIYSVGLVLYRLLNHNRLPFFPPAPQMIRFEDRENALIERMRGMKIQPPAAASKAFADIILKACAYEPEARYHTAAEMLHALENISGTEMQKEETGCDYKKEQDMYVPGAYVEEKIGEMKPQIPENSVWEENGTIDLQSMASGYPSQGNNGNAKLKGMAEGYPPQSVNKIAKQKGATPVYQIPVQNRGIDVKTTDENHTASGNGMKLLRIVIVLQLILQVAMWCEGWTIWEAMFYGIRSANMRYSLLYGFEACVLICFVYGSYKKTEWMYVVFCTIRNIIDFFIGTGDAYKISYLIRNENGVFGIILHCVILWGILKLIVKLLKNRRGKRPLLIVVTVIGYTVLVLDAFYYVDMWVLFIVLTVIGSLLMCKFLKRKAIAVNS